MSFHRLRDVNFFFLLHGRKVKFSNVNFLCIQKQTKKIFLIHVVKIFSSTNKYEGEKHLKSKLCGSLQWQHFSQSVSQGRTSWEAGWENSSSNKYSNHSEQYKPGQHIVKGLDNGSSTQRQRFRCAGYWNGLVQKQGLLREKGQVNVTSKHHNTNCYGRYVSVMKRSKVSRWTLLWSNFSC